MALTGDVALTWQFYFLSFSLKDVTKPHAPGPPNEVFLEVLR